MALNEATKTNLRRKSSYVDVVQLHEGRPLFSWIDLSVTELCNRSAGHPRACQFCPRADSKFYPNQNLHMSMALVEKIATELATINYSGVVVLCGYGEPMLHPELVTIVRTLKTRVEHCRVELVTNGDFLSPTKAAALYQAGVDFFVVSMYDGPYQVEILQRKFLDGQVPTTAYLLRDRWHSETDAFGLKLTNRGGTVSVGIQDPVDKRRPCHYLTYQLQVDWNGDVILCPQDWHKKLKFGNLSLESMVDVWFSKRLQKRREQLIRGYREEHPCSNCNTDGTLHGFNHVKAWGVK